MEAAEPYSVNEDTLIGEIVARYPSVVSVLASCGMHCVGCPSSQSETLREACLFHGLPVAPVVWAVNEMIASDTNDAPL